MNTCRKVKLSHCVDKKFFINTFKAYRYTCSGFFQVQQNTGLFLAFYQDCPYFTQSFCIEYGWGLDSIILPQVGSGFLVL